MPHMPHRTIKTTPKPTVADEAPVQRVANLGIGEKHLGTTRVPRSRVLKPPLG